jgi:hypothetical protein
MRTISVTLVVVLSCVALSAQRSSTQRPRPWQDEKPPLTIVDSDFPPASLEELAMESEAVLRVRIRNSNAKELGVRIVTLHEALILEVLKGQGLNPGTTVTIAAPVGRLESPGQPPRVTEAAGMVEFTQGQEILAFLRWWPAANAYSIAYGPVGFYQLDNNTVVLPEHARAWASFGGRRSVGKSEFLSELRSRIKRE